MMTQEQQRIDISEWMGWKWVKWERGHKRILVSPEHPIGLVQGQILLLCKDMSVPAEDSGYHQGPVPDFPNDLNAVQSAVLSQDKTFIREFDESLELLAMERGCCICELKASDWVTIFLQCKRG